jgi:hypothetical protein
MTCTPSPTCATTHATRLILASMLASMPSMSTKKTCSLLRLALNGRLRLPVSLHGAGIS